MPCEIAAREGIAEQVTLTTETRWRGEPFGLPGVRDTCTGNCRHQALSQSMPSVLEEQRRGWCSENRVKEARAEGEEDREGRRAHTLLGHWEKFLLL